MEHRPFVVNAMRISKDDGRVVGRDWSDAEVAYLKKLKAEGVGVTQIGKKLNRTKNAVCGKWWRLQGNKPEPKSSDEVRGGTWSTANLTEKWADRKKNRA